MSYVPTVRSAWQSPRRPPASLGVDTFLETVGYELADKAGLAAALWGDLAAQALIDEPMPDPTRRGDGTSPTS